MNDMYIPNTFQKIKTSVPKLDTRIISRINITGVSFEYSSQEMVPEYMTGFAGGYTFDNFINNGNNNINIVYFLNISSAGVNNVYFNYDKTISKWNISCLFGSVSRKVFSYDQVTKNQYYNIPFNNDGSSLDWGGPTFTCVFE